MKYITAIFLVCSVVLGFMAYYYHNRANSYCELWKNTQANNDYLIKQRKKDYEDTLAISIKAKRLEEEAEKEKAYFDWSADISRSNVIKQLQSN